MNKWLLVAIPAALFAFAIGAIVHGIDGMVAKEKGNRLHAMILGCEYLGPMERYSEVLVLKCADQIQLHAEVQW